MKSLLSLLFVVPLTVSGAGLVGGTLSPPPGTSNIVALVTNNMASLGGFTNSGVIQNTGVFTNSGTTSAFVGGSVVVSNSSVQNNTLLKTGGTGGGFKIQSVSPPAVIGGVLVQTTTGSPGFSGVLTAPTNITATSSIGSPGNAGAALNTIQAQFISGSAASLTDLPIFGKGIKSGMTLPVLGVTTDDPRATIANMLPVQTNYLYMTNIAAYFLTSGISAALSNYGTCTAFLGDGGWLQTNRDSTGGLLTLPTLFPGGFSNTISWCRNRGGMAVILADYYTSSNPLAGDSAYRGDFAGGNQNSYPSQESLSAVTYTFPLITSATLRNDIKFFQTNLVDGIMDQDDGTAFNGMQGYYHNMNTLIADAIQYIDTSDSAKVYWRAYDYLNNSPPHIDRAMVPGTFPLSYYGTNTFLPHELWRIHFENHPSWESQYYANSVVGDQGLFSVGTDAGLSAGMRYVRYFDAIGMGSWEDGNFVYESFNQLGNTAANYTNYYTIVGEFNAISFNQMTTNPFSNGALFGAWETNQTPCVTNTGFLSVWTDVEHYPRVVFDDGTNCVRIRKYKNNGQFAILGVNQGTTTSNYNVSVCPTGSDVSGSIGVSTNVIYTLTNVYQNTYAGMLTNIYQTNLVNATCSWVIATPLRVAVTNGGVVFYTSPVYAN